MSNRFNNSFIYISPRFQKEWVECINGNIIVEQICHITLRGLGIPHKETSAQNFTLRIPIPKERSKICSTLIFLLIYYTHSIRNFNKKWLVKTIWREKIDLCFGYQQSTFKHLPQNVKIDFPAVLADIERSLNISGLCICSC